jgi:hypothetical protein
MRVLAMRIRHASTRFIFALAALAAPVSAHAQEMAAAAAARTTPSACVRAAGPDITPPRGGMPRSPGDTTARAAATPGDTLPVAIRLIASVSADEVRFERSPIVCVKLSGDAQLDSVHVLARRNLATPVVRGTTYRDVYVAVEILGRLNADCIAGRITGTRPSVAGSDSTSAARCASLGVRTGAGGAPP